MPTAILHIIAPFDTMRICAEAEKHVGLTMLHTEAQPIGDSNPTGCNETAQRHLT